MTSIVELFPKSRKLTYDARQQLSQIQNNLQPPSELYLTLTEIKNQLQLLQQMLHRETPVQREMWKRKIMELNEEVHSIERKAECFNRLVDANGKVEREREELMLRRRIRKGGNGGGDAESAMTHFAEESDSLQSSQNMVGELLQSGQYQLQSLYEQRKRMGGVKRLVMDMGKKLGFSNHTMRMIERRDKTDAYLILGGMILTCFVIYLVWFR